MAGAVASVSGAAAEASVSGALEGASASAAAADASASSAATGAKVDGAGTGACGSERSADERVSGAGMAGGDDIEPPLPPRVAATESSRPGSDDSANRPRGSGLARSDAVSLGTAPTLGRSFAFALSISGAGSLARSSGLAIHAAVPSAMRTGTTTTLPITAITVHSDAVQERSPPDFRLRMAPVNRPESMGTPASNERLEANIQDAGTVERRLRGGETLTIP